MLLVPRFVMIEDDIGVLGNFGNHDAVGAGTAFVELDPAHDAWDEIVDIQFHLILKTKDFVTIKEVTFDKAAHPVAPDAVRVSVEVVVVHLGVNS